MRIEIQTTKSIKRLIKSEIDKAMKPYLRTQKRQGERILKLEEDEIKFVGGKK